MAHATSFGSRIDPLLAHIVRPFSSLRSEISGRLVERRVYNDIMQELWSMPNEYRLELGIDPYEYERFAWRQARLASSRPL